MSGKGWLCPICGHLNPADLAVCEKTMQHDEANAIRAKAMRDAGQIFADACARIARQTPEEAARAAYVPGGPSVDELAAKVRRLRAAYANAA